MNPDYNMPMYDYISHFENCVAAPTTVNDSMHLVDI
jgi:hypothetical protein